MSDKNVEHVFLDNFCRKFLCFIRFCSFLSSHCCCRCRRRRCYRLELCVVVAAAFSLIVAAIVGKWWCWWWNASGAVEVMPDLGINYEFFFSKLFLAIIWHGADHWSSSTLVSWFKIKTCWIIFMSNFAKVQGEEEVDDLDDFQALTRLPARSYQLKGL